MNTYQNQNLYQNQNNQGQAAPAKQQGNLQNTAEQQTGGGTPESWMNHPALGGINPAKLQMLSSLASQAQGKSQNELLPFLMAAASQSNSNQMSFNNDEIDTIINVMKLGKSQQEIQQIDRLCTLVKQFRQFSR